MFLWNVCIHNLIETIDFFYTIRGFKYDYKKSTIVQKIQLIEFYDVTLQPISNRG